MKRQEYEGIRDEARELMTKANIAVREEEWENYEVADYGLGNFYSVGLGIIVYVNTDRVCAKELILFPNQHSPEHRHPPVGGSEGKEETFRCRYGTCYLFVEGDPTETVSCQPPDLCGPWCTVWHQVTLNPGDQYTLMPNVLHWFQAGPEGCVVSEFSTHSDDGSDVFTNPSIRRIPVIEG